MRARALERFRDHGLRGHEVTQAVLVDLRHLLPRPRVEDARAARRGFPQLARGLPARAPLLPPRQPPEEPLPRGAGKPALERHPVAGLAAVGIGRSEEPAEPRQLVGAQIDAGRLRDGVRHPPGERHQGQDVVPVVLEDARHLAGRLPPQVVEVRLRDQRARQIVLADEAERVLLDGAEAAVGQPGAPQPPRRRQEVEVEGSFRPAAPGEHEARLEERQVEAGAVVGHEAVDLPQKRIEGGQQRRLFVEVAHEVLPHLELAAVEEAHAHEEGIGAGAAGQARRLRVEIEEARPARRRVDARAISASGPCAMSRAASIGWRP